MAWYAKQAATRRRQIGLDVTLLAWSALWIVVGVVVDGVVASLAKPLRSSIKSLEGVRDHVHDAATSAGSLPVGGGQLRPPVDAIGEQLNTMISSLNDQARQIELAGTMCGFGIPLVAILAFLLWWLPRRLRTMRRGAGSGSTLATRGAGPTANGPAIAAQSVDAGRQRISVADDRAALHAIMTALSAQLIAIDADPVGAWRRGEPQAVAALAELDTALRERAARREGS